MNRSFSKIRHIQESNMKLENRRLVEQSQNTSSISGSPTKENVEKEIKDAFAVFTEKAKQFRYDANMMDIIEIGYPGGTYGQYGGATIAPTGKKNTNLYIKIVCTAPRTVSEPPVLIGAGPTQGAYFPNIYGNKPANYGNNPDGQSFGASVCRAIYNDYERKNTKQQ